MEIINLQTRKPVFQSLVPGEVLFGAPEELFVKSAYFRQLFQNKNGDDALAEQVQNILFSADERISAEKAQKKLREAKAELRNAQNRGVIPDLEGKLARYRDECERARRFARAHSGPANETLTKTADELAREREKLSRLQDERRNVEKYAARAQLERLQAIDAAEAEAKRSYDRAAAEFSGADIPDTSAVRELMNDNAQYMAMLQERDRLAYESRAATDAYEKTSAVCSRWAGRGIRRPCCARARKTAVPRVPDRRIASVRLRRLLPVPAAARLGPRRGLVRCRTALRRRRTGRQAARGARCPAGSAIRIKRSCCTRSASCRSFESSASWRSAALMN